MDIKKSEWYVAEASLNDAQWLVQEYLYSKGGSNTAVYVHGLFRKMDNKLFGISWWLPPTKVAAQSITLEGPRRKGQRLAEDDWKHVLSLTRLVLLPDAPRNACTFLLGRSIKLIWKDSRFDGLVTYADESQGHVGTIYKASNWVYVGRTGPYPRWLDQYGRQVSPKATVNRTKAEMEALGHTKVGSYHKHKFVLHKESKCHSGTITFSTTGGIRANSGAVIGSLWRPSFISAETISC